MPDREILFKAKRADNGEWVEGYFLMGHAGDTYIAVVFVDFDFIPVISSTISQYTGLIDKHGVKIFEGDIISTGKYGKDDGSGHNFAAPDTFCIAFEAGGFCLQNDRRRFNLRPDTASEVIGNRWDTPELIRGAGHD